jgi:hypothetical protein
MLKGQLLDSFEAHNIIYHIRATKLLGRNSGRAACLSIHESSALCKMADITILLAY